MHNLLPGGLGFVLGLLPYMGCPLYGSGLQTSSYLYLEDQDFWQGLLPEPLEFHFTAPSFPFTQGKMGVPSSIFALL
jgi:hypothetical protein